MNEMTSENYVENAMNTDCQYDEECISRIINNTRLLHAAMGMVTEAAEMLDMLKKHFFYAKPFDIVNAKEELGDEAWYVALAVDEIRTTMNDVLTTNIAKLKLRYPNKFNGEDAINRDVKAERVLLEGAIDKDTQTLTGNFSLNADKEYEQNWVKYRFLTDTQHGNFVSHNTLFNIGNSGSLSKRGEDWVLFAMAVLDHIENYVIPQYGDKGDDPYTHSSKKEMLNQVTKYAFRQDQNSREGQDEIDLFKMAHCSQLAHNKLKGDV